jgi:hypothetical protein
MRFKNVKPLTNHNFVIVFFAKKMVELNITMMSGPDESLIIEFAYDESLY